MKTDDVHELVAHMSADGAPAFPTVAKTSRGHEVHCHGMTLRDYFAGQALAGMMAAPDNNGAVWDAYAKDAYALADAMLKARNRGVG